MISLDDKDNQAMQVQHITIVILALGTLVDSMLIDFDFAPEQQSFLPFKRVIVISQQLKLHHKRLDAFNTAWQGTTQKSFCKAELAEQICRIFC